MQSPPPLPADWPYRPRPALPGLEVAGPLSLPGLGRGWTLEASRGLSFPEEAQSLGGAFGRGGILSAGDLICRPYRRGGLVRLINRSTYPSPERFRQELQVHRALWEAGFPTIEPLGIAHRRRGWGVEGVFISRFAQGSPWPHCWAAPEVPAELPRAIGALIAWGLWSPDLNATNVMVGPQGILLLDWDKAAWSSAGDLRERYRERLQRSLSKLGAPEEVSDRIRS
nr:lipopolysaccharide kinase InaA family protein [uncultured Holophaga sp.]